MGDFQINVSEFRNYINYLNANRMLLMSEKAELTMQILKLRVAGNNTTTSVIRQRLGYEQRRLTKEINNIYAITNAANQIISEVEKADKNAKHEFNNLLENIIEAIFNTIPIHPIRPRPIFPRRPGILPIGPVFPGVVAPWNPWNPWVIRGIPPRSWVIDEWGRCRRETWRRIHGPIGIDINPNDILDIIPRGTRGIGGIADWVFNNRRLGQHDPLGFEIGGNYRGAFREYSGIANLSGLLISGTGTIGLNIMSGNISGGIFNKDGYFDPRFNANVNASTSVLHGESSISAGDSRFGASGSMSGDIGYAEGKGNVNASLFDADGRLNPNVDASISGRVAAMRGEAHGRIGNDTISLKGDAEGSVGDLSAEAHFKSGLRDANGNINPYLDAGADATAKGVSGKISGQFGNDRLNAHGEASGSIGYANANAKLKISNSEVRASAGAEAAVFKGSVSGGYNLFGLKVDGEVSGKAIAAGAHAGGGISDTGIDIDIGGSLGLGVDLKLKLDWSDTTAYKIIKDPTHIDKYLPTGNDIVKSVGGAIKGVQDFGNGVAGTVNNIAEGTGQFFGGVANNIGKWFTHH